MLTPGVSFYMRAAFYVDGFNVYHGVCDTLPNHLKWTSYWKLAECLIRKDGSENVTSVKLFTALPSWIPGSEARHKVFAIAQKAEGVKVIFGNFKEREMKCKICKQRYRKHEEKESDVNIALHLLADAYQNAFDVAYLVTADTDLAPAVKMVRQTFPDKRLVSVVPPGSRHPSSIDAFCDHHLRLRRKDFEASRLPETIISSTGAVLRCPEEYALPTA